MLEFITAEQAAALRSRKARRDDPELVQAMEIEKIYNRVLPEVGPLLEQASELARKRGYVRTLLGRRTRFPEKSRLHKALNGVIQGTAADIMKRKLIELHKGRKDTGLSLRYTVHDEVDGDIPDLEHAKRVAGVLNSQSFPEIVVPILWEVGIGQNWAMLKDVA
jgi:DNA polymerase-1